jgi:glutaconate CoA-transferase subunit A
VSVTETLERRSLIIDEVEAGRWILDGMTVALGGFITSSHPMALVRQIIRNKVRDLTVIGSASSGLDVDILIGAGCVRKVISPYVGAETLAPIGPFFRAAAERGEIQVWEIDEAMFYVGLRAAAQLLPFLPWRGLVGTSYPEVNRDLKVFKDPIKGETLIAVPAIAPDVALIHAAYADPYGNVQHEGTGFGDRALHLAADKTIVEVERIVSNQDLRTDPIRTSLWEADAVVRAPYGAHPYSSPGFYVEDRDHIREYVTAAQAYLKTGDRAPFLAFLDRYVFECPTHGDYLERVGIKRLFTLYEH